MAGGVFQGLAQALNSSLDSMASGQIAQYSSMISVIVTSSVTLYLIVCGYMQMAGKLRTEDFGYNIVKMSIILTFVNNSGGYLDSAIDAINGLKEGISGSDSVWAILDSLWYKTQVLADTIYKLGDEDWVNIRGAVGLCFVWAGAVITMICSAFTFLSAEITIKLMTWVSPIFIFCLMYGFLRPMFNNWLMAIISSVLTLMFASLVLKIGTNYLDKTIQKATTLVESVNIITLAVQVFIIYIAAAFLVWLSAKIATQLAGVGVDGAIQGAAAMGVIGGGFAAARATSGAGGIVKNMGVGAYEGAKGKSWQDKSAEGISGAVAYGSGLVGRAAIQKVISKNLSSSNNIPTAKVR
ncbi:TPA: type IV secretion system protein [Escherichia coli]|nr:type IV secretion system protein [Escherichia coli]